LGAANDVVNLSGALSTNLTLGVAGNIGTVGNGPRLALDLDFLLHPAFR